MRTAASHPGAAAVVAFAAFATLAAPSVASAQTTPPPREPLTAPAVRVHVVGSPSAKLEEDVTGTDDWREVCSSPCDTDLPIGPRYRVNGEGRIPSEPFGLAGRPGDRVAVRVAGGSKAWFVAGIVLVPAGTLVALTGIAIDLMAPLASLSRGDVKGTLAIGSTTLAVGIAALVTAIILINGHSRSSAALQIELPTDGAHRGAEPGRAAWREAPSAETALPPVAGGSFFTVRF
ncbi:MAG TPA: hypothetical protein VIY73_26830 [Polyangiaceae bacterium]